MKIKLQLLTLLLVPLHHWQATAQHEETWNPAKPIPETAETAEVDAEVAPEALKGDDGDPVLEHAPPRNECSEQGEGCEDDEWCDKDKTPRRCWAKRPIDDQCNRDEKCLSDCCSDDDRCVSSSHCGVDPCDGVVCEDPDHHCHEGVCHGHGDPCDEVHCPEGTYCEDGWCYVEDKCKDVECPVSQYCNPDDGFCYFLDPCHDVDCPHPKVCEEGICIQPDPCFGVHCDEGQICNEWGECEEIDLCEGVACTGLQYCDPTDGKCYLIDPCSVVTCPEDEICNEHGQCVDACLYISCPDGYYCHHGECVEEEDPCDTVNCPEGQVCVIGCPEGKVCIHNLPVCVFEDLCYGVTCPPTKFCDEGQCFPKRPVNEPCGGDDEKCLTGCCGANNKCEACVDLCATVRCAEGWFCFEGNCYNSNPCHDVSCPAGKYCVDGECVSENPCELVDCPAAHWCLDGLCYPPFCNNDNQCPPGYNCNRQDTCVAAPACVVDANCQQDEVCTDGVCVAVECVGDNDWQCESHLYCEDNLCLPYCYRQSQCPDTRFCEASTHKCKRKLDHGDRCSANHECSSGFCNDRRQPSRCHQGYGEGRWCEHDYECLSKHCHENYCRSSRLQIGEECFGDDELCLSGYCSCHTGLCAQLKRDEAYCHRSCECESDFCNFNVCTEKFGLGHVCDSDYQCASNSCWDCPTISRGNRPCEPTCVPIMGEEGDYCTSDLQCKSEKCQRSECVENRNLPKRLGGWT